MSIIRDSESIFAEGFIDGTLKNNNTNLFTEAVIYDEISRRSYKAIKEFCDSPEAKDMVNSGVISQDMIDRLENIPEDRTREIKAAHLASERDDPLWQELIAARREERRIMNELLNKYNGADDIANKVRQEIIDRKIPTKFIMHEE